MGDSEKFGDTKNSNQDDPKRSGRNAVLINLNGNLITELYLVWKLFGALFKERLGKQKS